jgi:hypothetical protein
VSLLRPSHTQASERAEAEAPGGLADRAAA